MFYKFRNRGFVSTARERIIEICEGKRSDREGQGQFLGRQFFEGRINFVNPTLESVKRGTGVQ